jgi:WD40 repeat protein
MSSHQYHQNHLVDVPLTQDIAGLLRDVHWASQLYADPMTSHALQVYHSVLATVPHCRLLDNTESGQIVAPRLVSQRTSDWSSVVKAIKGHTDYVSSVAYSPDGTHIVSGSDDKTARVWDAVTGKQLAVLEGHTNWVSSAAFSPDGAHIVSGSYDRTIRVWDAYTGKQLAVLEGHTRWVKSVAFTPDGAHIVSGSDDTTVRVWDAHSGKQLAVLEGHMDWVRSVAFSSDGAHIVSGSDDRTVRVWDAHTGKQFAVLKGHKHDVTSVSFSPDGARITSKDEFGTELAWNVQSTLPLHEQFLMRVVAHTLSGEHESTSVEGSNAELQPAPTEGLVWSKNSGWISWQRPDRRSIRLCWLPHERRGKTFASYNMTAAIGARNGAVTILDFSEVIATIDAAA